MNINRRARNVKFDKMARVAVFALCVPAIQGCVGVAATGTAAGAVATQDRRTAGTIVDDELIELKVQAAIHADETLVDQTHVNVTSFNGIVLLTGEAPGESLRSRVVEIARGVPKVRRVQSEIALQAPSSILARTGDSVVTGKVKAALLANNALRGIRVKVVTERGTVYLMGLLGQAEANRATDIARRVAGVQRVVKVLEYIQ